MSSECLILWSLDTTMFWFLHAYSVLLFFFTPGIDTSLLFTFFIAVSLKLFPTVLYLSPYFCILSWALHVWHSTARVPGKFRDSPVECKRPLSSRAEGETSQCAFLHCIHWSHHDRAQFGSYWCFTRYWRGGVKKICEVEAIPGRGRGKKGMLTVSVENKITGN